MPAWVEPIVSQLWSFIAVALAVYALGVTSKRIAERFGWRRVRRSDRSLLERRSRATSSDDSSDPDAVLPADASWYDITLRLHPIVVGALFGLIPLPALHAIDSLAKDPDYGPHVVIVARCAWFMLAGALSGQVYETLKFAFREGRARLFGLFGGASSKPPSVPPPPAPPAPPSDVASGNEER